MTPRATVLLFALIAASCAQVSPQELSARYNLDDIRRDNISSGPTPLPSPDDGGNEPGSGDTPNLADHDPYDLFTVACPFETEFIDVTTECGYVLLPGGEGSDRPVRLTFAHFLSSSDDPEPDPVIYLHGGPGGSVLSDADRFFESVVSPFIEERDVILYDQRGGGESSPLPVCDAAWSLDAAFFLEDRDHVEIERDYVDVVAECGRELSESSNFDLTTYNSVTHANDTVELARSLGIDRFNVHASSYGTRLAQALLRDHPERIRSAVLTGFYPTEVNLIGSVPSSLESALQAVFDACSADSVCGPALPDPWSTLEEAVASFSISPVPYESPYYDVPALIDGDEIVNGLHSLLYNAGAAAMIPDALIDFEDGDLDRMTRIGATSITDITDVAGFVAVQCHEEAPFTTDDEHDAADAISRAVDRVNLAPGFIGGGLLDVCPAWQTGTAQTAADDPTTWDVPTLLFSGAFDPITPPDWAAATADRLANITHVHFLDRGHDADEGSCAVALMGQFVTAPEEPLDTDCADAAPLTLDNRAGRFQSGASLDFNETIFDIEPGAETTWADLVVPDWEGYFIEDEDAYYRNQDWLDTTTLIIRNGRFDAAELTWYLEGYFGEQFTTTDTPGQFADSWERRILERTGSDLVAYVRRGEPALTVALVAESGELAELERRVVFAVLESFSP